MNGRSHYDVLGLAPGASPEAVREAYRRLAREFHPDRTVGSAVGGERMPQINEAYRVLSDPGRRAVYDAERRGGTTTSARGGSTGDPAAAEWTSAESADMSTHAYGFPDGPARIPWRSLAVFSAIAIIGIVVLAQFSKPSGPAAPDGILRGGDCVEVVETSFVKEIPCSGSGDLVIRQFIAFDRDCSNGWLPFQDRQGMGKACVEQEPEVPSTA